MNKLIVLPEGVKEFQANGTTYFVEDELAVSRFRMFQKFQQEIVTGTSSADIIQLLKNNVANLNKAMKGDEVLAQMSYENINALNWASKLDEKYPFEMWICVLFINSKDEERTKFDLPVMQKKLADFEMEGIAVDFFISLAEAVCGVPPGAFRYHTLNYLADPQNEVNLNVINPELVERMVNQPDRNTSLINSEI